MRQHGAWFSMAPAALCASRAFAGLIGCLRFLAMRCSEVIARLGLARTPGRPGASCAVPAARPARTPSGSCGRSTAHARRAVSRAWGACGRNRAGRGWWGRGVLWASSCFCGGHLAGLPARKQGPIVRPHVGRVAPEGLLQLVGDPMCELLRGGEHLEDLSAALDRHDPPLGLREGRARSNVLDAAADGVSPAAAASRMRTLPKYSSRPVCWQAGHTTHVTRANKASLTAWSRRHVRRENSAPQRLHIAASPGRPALASTGRTFSLRVPRRLRLRMRPLPLSIPPTPRL